MTNDWSNAFGDAPASFDRRVRETLDSLDEGKKTRRLGRRTLSALVAAAALVTVLAVTAVATDFFGLGSVKVDDPYATAAQTQDMIALQGYPESNEYKATAEWMAFLAGYDKNHAILNSIGNSPTGLEDVYGFYYVYTREMADKLDEITARYGLRLHQSMDVYDSADGLYQKAGTKPFLTGCTAISGYVYDDGSFQFDGTSAADGKEFTYQFGRYVKGVFSDVTLNVGSAKDYEEWDYKTASGVTVQLSMGRDKCILMADLPNSFISVNILGGTASDGRTPAGAGMTRQALENFADLFDFSRLG